MSDWRYVNMPVIIGITTDGQASMLFRVLPPGDRKVEDVEDVAKVCLPVGILRQLHTSLGAMMAQMDKMVDGRNATLRAAVDEADEVLRKIGDGSHAG